jgi:N-acetylmuramoyl-L-alanine amidase
MVKARLVFACLFLLLTLPLQAFSWVTATYNGREYVTLQSFCAFYGFGYRAPMGNNYFRSQNQGHSIGLKLGTSDLYLDGVHYVMSFPVEEYGNDWLVSRMDVIKLFEPVLRPSEISGRHTIRGVVIDAGHGGTDNGAVSARGGMEKNYTLDTAFRLESILRGAGLKTVLTRRNDTFVDLYERAHIASLYPDYCFVSIHFNSAEAEARGLETYCLAPRGAASTSSAYLTRADIEKLTGNDDDGQNILLASMVHSEIVRLNPGDPSADRGVKRARFVVIKANVLPAILVEGGFVSNRMEAARVNRPDYRQDLAEAIARGVIRFVNAMSSRHLSLPSSSSLPGEQTEDSGAPPPRALPVVPPAPSGLAREHGASHNSAAAAAPAASLTDKSSSTATGTTPTIKTRKLKRLAAHHHLTPATTNTATASAPEKSTPAVAPPSATADDTTKSAKSAETPGAAPLNLTEPAAPAAAAVSDKAAPEPDEPPTVSIYTPAAPKTPDPATPTAVTPAAPSNAAATDPPKPSAPAPAAVTNAP